MPKRRGRGEGGLEELPSGKWRAVVSRVVNGKRIRESKAFDTKKEALAWRTSRKGGPAAAGTLGEWLTTWLEIHKAATSPSNYRTDSAMVRRRVRPGLGATRLRDLTPVKIELWHAKLKADGVSQGERHKAGRTLRKALNAAAERGVIPAPVKVRVPKKATPDTGSLTRLELLALIDAAEGCGFGAMFRLWADSGCRPGELTGLRKGDFDPAAGTVSFRRSICGVTHEPKELKTKRSRRTLPLGASTVAAVKEYVRLSRTPATSPLFTAENGALWKYPNFMATAFAKVRDKVKFKVTPYTLRHTMATLLLQAGVSLKVVSERLGHEDVGTTLRNYAHILPGMQEIAAAKMDEILTAGAAQPQGEVK